MARTKKPTHQKAKPMRQSINTTQADVEVRDPVLDASEPEIPETTPETAPDLPRYQDGCPECHERSLVTELKIKSWRQCRCRECGWRGEMED